MGLRPTFVRPCSKRRTVSSEIIKQAINNEAARNSVMAMNQPQPQPPQQEPPKKKHPLEEYKGLKSENLELPQKMFGDMRDLMKHRL